MSEAPTFELPPFDWPVRERADFELGDDVVPTEYELELDLPRGSAPYSGRVQISVMVNSSVSTLWLHATHFETIRARVLQSGREDVAELVYRPELDQMGLQLHAPLRQGPAVLELSFQGMPGEFGIFRRGTTYFTQFEAIHARTAFPCFDEPRFKTPWTLHVTVDEGLQVFANTPMVKVELGTGKSRFTFATTRPLPSYLVAFAAGELAAQPVDDATSGMRIIGSPQQIAWNRFEHVRSVAPGILGSVKNYLGLDPPYLKQDLVSVPKFAFGGMENPGLITVGEGWMMAGAGFDEGLKDIIAHEFAHLWFGDSVTMRWWDDTWLNESLAKWIAEKVLPSSWRIGMREWVLELDALPGSRPVQQPMSTPASFREAWFFGERKISVPDWGQSTSWTKGAQMLQMVEPLVGEAAFQRGLKHYLQKHADGVVTAQDFALALSEGARFDLRPIIKSFVTQTGLPMITASLECSDKKALLTLAQEPYQLVGEPPQSKLWHVPVCTSFPGGKECFVLRARKTRFELPSCPSWLQLDPDAKGLYRYLLPETAALEIARHQSSHEATELASLAYALTAGLKSGQVPLDHAMEIFGLLSKSEQTPVLRASLEGFELIADLLQGMPSSSFARLIAETWGPVAIRLQPISRRLDDRQLAEDVVRFAGVDGHYGPLLEQAQTAKASRASTRMQGEALGDIGALHEASPSDSTPITPTTVQILLKSRATRQRGFQWIVQNFESTKGTWAFLGGDDPYRFLAYIRDAGGLSWETHQSSLCAEEDAIMLENFATPRLQKIESADRADATEVVKLSLANIRRCAALAAHHRAGLQVWSTPQ